MTHNRPSFVCAIWHHSIAVLNAQILKIYSQHSAQSASDASVQGAGGGQIIFFMGPFHGDVPTSFPAKPLSISGASPGSKGFFDPQNLSLKNIYPIIIIINIKITALRSQPCFHFSRAISVWHPIRIPNIKNR